MTLFDDQVGRPAPDVAAGPGTPHVVGVVPDVPAMDRVLDYRVPESLASQVTPGTVVRVPLHGRRVRGWVVATGAASRSPGRLLEVAATSGMGPDGDVIDLCRWAAWRWAGRLPTMLRFATPERVVPSPSRRRPTRADPSATPGTEAAVAASELLSRGPGTHVLTVSPTTHPADVALPAAVLGQALVVLPQVRMADAVAQVLGRAGASVARWPAGFALAAAGHTVVGGRSAVWAPLPGLAAVVVFDEHDEGLQHESSPTWHAREVAVERARRAGVPCLLVSPSPSPDALMAATSPPGVLSAAARRAGWPALRVVDRREDDPRTGLFSSAFVEASRGAREEGRAVVCILNRKGRARLLGCRSCRSVAECDECGAAVHTEQVAAPAVADLGGEVEVLACPRCGSTRPLVCLDCGASGMSILRAGVTRAAEELEALLGESVGVVSAGSKDGRNVRRARSGVLLGTEALLHRARHLADGPIGLVAFLDFDQELLAGRYRAAEEAMALLVSASRLAGGRDGAGVLVQTRKPDHPVLEAALRSDPGGLAASESARRQVLGVPPAATVAAVGGDAAPEWMERFGRPAGIEVNGPRDGWWLLRADDQRVLADACARVERPPGRLRLRVDPVRLP